MVSASFGRRSCRECDQDGIEVQLAGCFRGSFGENAGLSASIPRAFPMSADAAGSAGENSQTARLSMTEECDFRSSQTGLTWGICEIWDRNRK